MLTVEDPVGGSGETDTLGSVLQGEDFGAVDPADGSLMGMSATNVIDRTNRSRTYPGETVDADEDVGERDDCLSSRALDLPLQVLALSLSWQSRAPLALAPSCPS